MPCRKPHKRLNLPNASRAGACLVDPRWQPLEARSAAEIVAQHPDPLDALSKGVFPAIILRGQMQKIEVATALQRLNEGRAERTPSLPWHEGRACNYGTLGVDMHAVCTSLAAGEETAWTRSLCRGLRKLDAGILACGARAAHRCFAQCREGTCRPSDRGHGARSRFKC